MKKFVVFLCLCATLISFGGCKKNYTHGVYEVTIQANEIFNDSVGKDWQKSYWCDGESIYSGQRWTVPLDDEKTINIAVRLTENDNRPDYGQGKMSVVLRDGFSTSTKITVIENRGRYSGNAAQWEIICKVKLIKKTEQ